MPIPNTERARKQAAFEAAIETLKAGIKAQRQIAKMAGQQFQLMGAA